MFLSLAVWASFMTITAAPTTTQRWLDPNITRVNTLNPRSSFFAYENLDKARSGQKERSSRFMTLEGTWKFWPPLSASTSVCWMAHGTHLSRMASARASPVT